MAESNPEVGGRVNRMCQPCLNKGTKRSADLFCQTCSEFQCRDCSNIHITHKFLKYHIECVSQRTCITNDRDAVDMDGLDICEKHNKPFEFYCDDDKLLVCSSCAILDHRKCDKILDIAAIAKKDQCNELQEKLQTAIITTNQAVENIKEAESHIKSDLKRIPEQLNVMKQTINELFDDFAEKVTKDAESYQDATIEDWRQKNIECENKIKSMKKTLKSIDIIARGGTASQQFITVHRMTETIQYEVKNVHSLCADLNTLNVSCNFDECFDTLSSSLLSAMKPGEFEMKYSVPKKTKLELISSIDLKQMGDDVSQPLFTGLDFLPDGRLVAVDNNNGKCLVYDENLNLKSAYKFQSTNPYSAVVVSDEEVAITSGVDCRLDVLHVSKSNEITLIRTCNFNPINYYVYSMDDDINAVSTIDHDKVRFVLTTGVENDFDIELPSKKYPIDTSCCTHIRGQDKCLFTNRDADALYIFDFETGEKVVIKDELIEAPYGFAIGPYDHVFVGSNSTRSLVEITPEGRLLTSHQIDMCHPRYLAVSKDRRRLAVSNVAIEAKKLKLYQII